MLKQAIGKHEASPKPAAFGQLCVETVVAGAAVVAGTDQPSSGGCVLKQPFDNPHLTKPEPAAFRRRCVKTVATSYFKEVS